jgi:hypothetical protein
MLSLRLRNTYTLVLLVFGSTLMVTLPLIVTLSSTKSMADVAGLIDDVDDGDCVIEGVLETPSVGTDDTTGEDAEDSTDVGMELVATGIVVPDPETKDTEMEPMLMSGPVEVLLLLD